MPRPPLALVLLRASRWFDARLLTELEQRGWPRLTPPQSLVFAHLPEEGVAPSELARRLGTSRQATQELVAGLTRHDLLEVVPDPRRRNGRLVTLTTRGRVLARDARDVLADLEATLDDGSVDALHGLLGGIGTVGARDEPAG